MPDLEDLVMRGYYSERLAGVRLRACYEAAPPRVRAYLEAEIEFVLGRIAPSMAVLGLGCGYGRVLRRLAPSARSVVGIDTSLPSLRMALGYVGSAASVSLVRMDAAALGFRDACFDVTVCIQNGISAFGVDPRRILAEAVRVTRSGGRVLVSSYSERFWEARLEWFEIQASLGLIGEIDRRATGNGVIVCKDGFRATTLDAPRRFRQNGGRRIGASRIRSPIKSLLSPSGSRTVRRWSPSVHSRPGTSRGSTSAP